MRRPRRSLSPVLFGLALLAVVPTALAQPALTASGIPGAAVRLALDEPAAAVAPAAGGDPVTLALDDGSRDNDIGIGGIQEFIFLNRFTPAAAEFPFALEEIQVHFSSGGLVNVGDNILLAVYENTSGSADPAVGSNLLATFPATVQALDSWSVYALATPLTLSGPGDVLIGVIALEVPGSSYWPASLDQTTTRQRSWAGWWQSSPPASPTLPPDDTWFMIDTYFPGNWLIRGAGRVMGPTELRAIGARSLTEGETLNIALAVDEPVSSRTYAFSADNLPAGAQLDTTSGAFSWRPRYDQAGSYEVTFIATDDDTPAWSDSETVTITVNNPVGPIFVEPFDTTGNLAGDPDWVVLAGSWAVNSLEQLSSRSTIDGLAALSLFPPADFPFPAGVISTKVKLTPHFGRYANASIIFSRQDGAVRTGTVVATKGLPRSFRFVHIRPGRVYIGQAGVVGTETYGIKAKVDVPTLRSGRWYRISARIHPDGLVELLRGNTVLASYTFPENVPGGIGLSTRRSRALFDDFTVLDDAALDR